jgi:hypothetical protein
MPWLRAGGGRPRAAEFVEFFSCVRPHRNKPMNDAEKRLAALWEYKSMDTPPEQAFDELTQLTRFICGTPIVLVTLLDLKRPWFKSVVGLSVSETPLEHAFCAHAIKQEKVFLVPNASRDDANFWRNVED